MHNNGSAFLWKYKIIEIEVRYSSEPEGTIDMCTEWAIKRDTTAFSGKFVSNLNENR